jgi:hypothetical protein
MQRWVAVREKDSCSRLVTSTCLQHFSNPGVSYLSDGDPMAEARGHHVRRDSA